jgi:transcriptional regulator of acetoin/glycerol metabolism
LLAVEEKRILLTLLEGHAWDVEQVHQRLDISRSGLYHRMKKHGIKR